MKTLTLDFSAFKQVYVGSKKCRSKFQFWPRKWWL